MYRGVPAVGALAALATYSYQGVMMSAGRCKADETGAIWSAAGDP